MKQRGVDFPCLAFCQKEALVNRFTVTSLFSSCKEIAHTHTIHDMAS